MKNLGQMMKQAQEMQAKIQELQERLNQMEISGSAGGGMVQVTLTGKGEMRAIKIDPSLADPEDIEVLEDLVVAAVNDAKTRGEQHAAEEMQKLTGGIKLPPGMQLPF